MAYLKSDFIVERPCTELAESGRSRALSILDRLSSLKKVDL
jgi:hypothetical protein